MAKPKLRDLLRGATGGDASPSPVDPVAPGSTPPAVVNSTVPKAAGGAPIRRRAPTEEEARAQIRRLKIRAFCRAMLAIGEPTFNNATASYRVIDPEAKATVCSQEGWRLMTDEDVKEEMTRQLRAIDRAADLNDQWVYDRWRAIANATIFDYMDVKDGVAVFRLDPLLLTPEQKLAIEEIRVDPKTGAITHFKLASKNAAIANVAKARQMIDGKRDPGMVDLAQRITERMNKAAARIGRTFDEEGNLV